jgi:hypothetical protein
MSTIPSPSVMAKFKAPVATEVVVADVQPVDPGTTVRPGLRDEVQALAHDGVVKTKHLQPGQVVRAFAHGEPRGGERVIESIERLDDGAMVLVTFSSPHPPTEYKAAYRWYDASLEGATIRRTRQVPALVAYEEV